MIFLVLGSLRLFVGLSLRLFGESRSKLRCEDGVLYCLSSFRLIRSLHSDSESEVGLGYVNFSGVSTGRPSDNTACRLRRVAVRGECSESRSLLRVTLLSDLGELLCEAADFEVAVGAVYPLLKGTGDVAE